MSRQIDREKLAATNEKLLGLVESSVTMAVMSVADRSGLLRVLSQHDRSMRLDEISELGNLHPRYVLEVCGCLACAGILEHDEESNGFRLPPEAATLLCEPAFPMCWAGWADMVPALFSSIPGVTEAMCTPTHSAGVAFDKFSQWGFARGMERTNGPGVASQLVRKWMPKAVPGVVQRLTKGIRVADLGTGAGAAAFAIAHAFPDSDVVGIDLDQNSINRARQLAALADLRNLRFLCCDMGTIEAESYDLVVNHDCIHDLADPVEVLRAVLKSLRPGGLFFSIEPLCAGETLEENVRAASTNASLASKLAMKYGMWFGSIASD